MTYSPRESWKNKPFSKEDAHFFFKGIEELSERFTEERSRGVPNYFLHPKYRSAYLLYFFPLQAAKFLTLYDRHPGAMEAAVEHGIKTGRLRIADLGAGPGTASIAALLWLLKWSDKNKKPLPEIELVWFDTNGTTMHDGKALVAKLADGFSKLRDKVSLVTHTAPWWEIVRTSGETPFSLVLLGHVLNEAAGPAPSSEDDGRHEKWHKLWTGILERTAGGGALFVEPASRRTAQGLSLLRDHLLEGGLIEDDAVSFWGPCLHAGHCPFAEGRDWCHVSFPTQIPGKWFREFSKGLGSERLWLKMSYLWIASRDVPAPRPNAQLRRVISDPLDAAKTEVLLCEPDAAVHHKIRPGAKVFRGDVIHSSSVLPRSPKK